MMSPKELAQAEQILLNNLSLLRKDSGVHGEEKTLILRELFDLLVADAPSFDVAVDRLLSVYNDFLLSFDENRLSDAEQTTASELVRTEERLILATFLSNAYPDRMPINGQYELPSLPAAISVSCLNANGLSLQACERIGELFLEWHVQGAGNYTEICEAVSRDQAVLGILPIENSPNGRLSGFYSMLDRYDLKICAVCDVEDEVNESATRFALISRTFYNLFSLSGTKLIEISAVSANAGAAIELIFAAGCLGLPVKRLFSAPLYYRGDACKDTVTLELSEDGIRPFLMYLYLFNKDVNILGYYIQI